MATRKTPTKTTPAEQLYTLRLTKQEMGILASGMLRFTEVAMEARKRIALPKEDYDAINELSIKLDKKWETITNASSQRR